VLDVAEREQLPARLEHVGATLRVAAARALGHVPGATVQGIAPMWFIRFATPAQEHAWLAALVRRGVIAKRGPYNFAALAHDDATCATIANAFTAAAAELPPA
jgi:glutamate-1-semialdehyde 2,1-aminomutase